LGNTPPSLPSYSLQLRAQGTRTFYEVMFRIDGRQVKRRVGPAWVTPAGKPRRGRPRDGCLDVATAHDRAREIVADRAAKAADPQAAGPTFREVARDYLRWLKRFRGAKPSTLADHGYALAEPNGTTSGQVMLALGDRACGRGHAPRRRELARCPRRVRCVASDDQQAARPPARGHRPDAGTDARAAPVEGGAGDTDLLIRPVNRL
jgi:hypothetical protein